MKGQTTGVTTASKWRWVFSGGGKPPARQAPLGGSDLYFTGHEDGRVRVWDATGNVPGLLATVPFDSGGPGVRLRPVSCFQVRGAPWLLPLRLLLQAWGLSSFGGGGGRDLAKGSSATRFCQSLPSGVAFGVLGAEPVGKSLHC